MGVLRVLLALAVVFAHIGWVDRVGNSRLAVEIFYLISGFLISYVLNRDGAYRSVARFYLNRALRIYPAYWVCAGAGLLTLAVDPYIRAHGHALHGGAIALLAAANLLIFGQDAVMFLQQSGNGLALAKDFNLTDPQLWHFLVLPPAWSLAVELTFYLIAPFILRRSPLVIVFALTSASLTLWGWQAGLDHDPWTYRFFPFCLSLFLVGALSERMLPRPKQGANLAIAPIAACVVFALYPYMRLPEPWGSLLILAVIAALLPALFIFQDGRRWDSYVGELSYPIYICHWPIVSGLSAVWTRLLPGETRAQPFVTLISVLAGALLLERYVARPVERLRLKVRQKPAPIDAATAFSSILPLEPDAAKSPSITVADGRADR